MPQPAPTQRGGYSLLELVLAIALVGGTLAPAMALLRDGVELSRTIDNRQLLANYAIQQLERRMAIVASGWTANTFGTDVGNFSAEGFPLIYHNVIWSDQAASGGRPGELMNITSLTYYDTNANGALDTGEPTCTFRTKIAQIPNYVATASP